MWYNGINIKTNENVAIKVAGTDTIQTYLINHNIPNDEELPKNISLKSVTSDVSKWLKFAEVKLSHPAKRPAKDKEDSVIIFGIFISFNAVQPWNMFCI